MMGMICFVLQLPTGTPEHPGKIGDYLGAYHFRITFTSIAEPDLEYDVEAARGEDIAGSA
jgi:hypothetical protein